VGELRTSFPRFRRAEGPPPRVELTSDDIDILRTVHRHRFVRADQLYQLFPERSSDRLSRRLTLLFRAGYLGRPLAQINRFQEGGSQPLVYGLDRLGARFLKEETGAAIGETDWKARNRAFKRENLDHTLATASFLINLELECRKMPNVSLIMFDEMLARAPEKTRRSPMPGRWSVPMRHNGSRTDVLLAPDAIFGLRMARDDAPPLTSYFFLEVDRGTMTIVPARRIREGDAFLHRATVLRKMLTYAESWRTGLHRDQFGISNARVLFLTSSARRAAVMQRTASDLVLKPLQLPSMLFLFGGELAARSPLRSNWVDGLGRVLALFPAGELDGTRPADV
jgi:hypothetical protein